LNFGGTSKGNPRKIGYGGRLRNNIFLPPYIYSGTFGNNRNNVVELTALLKGLEIEKKIGLQQNFCGRRF